MSQSRQPRRWGQPSPNQSARRLRRQRRTSRNPWTRQLRPSLDRRRPAAFIGSSSTAECGSWTRRPRELSVRRPFERITAVQRHRWLAIPAHRRWAPQRRTRFGAWYEPCQVTLFIACRHRRRQQMSRKNEALGGQFAAPNVDGIVNRGDCDPLPNLRRCAPPPQASSREVLYGPEAGMAR